MMLQFELQITSCPVSDKKNGSADRLQTIRLFDWQTIKNQILQVESGNSTCRIARATQTDVNL
jgi:hypothetical protein